MILFIFARPFNPFIALFIIGVLFFFIARFIEFIPVVVLFVFLVGLYILGITSPDSASIWGLLFLMISNVLPFHHDINGRTYAGKYYLKVPEGIIPAILVIAIINSTFNPMIVESNASIFFISCVIGLIFWFLENFR